MDFRCLGLLEVVEDGRSLALTRGRETSLLALLLIEAGRPVSSERILEALWPDEPPENGAKSVQVYVSRLRRAIGAERIETTSAGYRLRVEPGELDVDRFERHARRGAEALVRGDAADADRALTDALAVWRGEAFADVRFAAFAQEEIRRLEARRRAVEADRIDAWLALGREQDAIAVLERLVDESPLDERLRAQLMLALYRAGRQSDALGIYRGTRRLLDEELGLEPSPELRELERRILEHDPALGAPRRPPLPHPRARRALLLFAGGALVAVAALAAAIVLATRGGEATTGIASVAPGSLARIDPATNRVVAQVPVGSGPTGVGVADGKVWVADAASRSLLDVDERSLAIGVRTPLPTIPTQLAVGATDVWLTSPFEARRGSLVRVDRVTRAISSVTVRSEVPDDLFAPPTPGVVAAAADTAWTDAGSGDLFRATGDAGATLDVGGGHSVDGVTTGAGAVWFTSSIDDSVRRVDERTGRYVAPPIRLASVPGRRAASPAGLAYGFGSVWVAEALGDRVTRIDPQRNAVVGSVPVGDRPTDVAVGAGSVWVLNAGDGTVSRIDPESEQVTATVLVGRLTTAITADDRGVWVTVGGGAPAPSAAPPRPARALATSACSRVVSGGAAPDLIVVSSLPTYAGDGQASPEIRDIRRVILAVLEERGFRAGPYRVGYQACSDSTRDASPDPETCAANAHAYAGAASVVGVVGPYQSFCAKIQLPILNTAPGGPVAVVSPSTTYVGLTHGGPQTEASEPDRYFPTGVRSFVRVSPPDDAQAAALVELARRRGLERLFLLDDGDPTGEAMTTYVKRGARRAGLSVIGTAHWADRGQFMPVGARVARSSPDAVVLAGCVCIAGGELLRDLETSLGSKVALLATDSFTIAGDMADPSAPRLVRRLLFTAGSRAATRLPPEGTAFLRRVFPGRPLSDVTMFAAPAAASMEVLLDAIARSDGTRASVVEELSRTRAVGTPIGSFAFDVDGDATTAPVTVYRVAHRPAPHLPVEGIVPVTVIDADPGLVAP